MIFVTLKNLIKLADICEYQCCALRFIFRRRRRRDKNNVTKWNEP